MLALAGFALGYIVGAKEGQEGLERMVKATKAVLASDEFKAALETAQSLAGGLLKQGFDRFAGGGGADVRGFASKLRVA